MTVEPPKRVVPQQIPPREYVFIMDVSGSMNGFPLEVSKTMMQNLLTTLRPIDRFNILFFAGGAQTLSQTSLSATPDHIDDALGTIIFLLPAELGDELPIAHFRNESEV